MDYKDMNFKYTKLKDIRLVKNFMPINAMFPLEKSKKIYIFTHSCQPHEPFLNTP